MRTSSPEFKLARRQRAEEILRQRGGLMTLAEASRLAHAELVAEGRQVARAAQSASLLRRLEAAAGSDPIAAELLGEHRERMARRGF